MLSSLPGIGKIDHVRIAVGIDQRDRGDAQLLGFADRVLFLLRIDDHEALGQPVHRADAVEVAEHLAIFAVEGRLHLLRVRVPLGLVGLEAFELFEAAEPAANRAEVGERAAQPAIVDVGHAAAQRLRARWRRPLDASCRRTARGCLARRSASGISWHAAGRERFRGRR